MNEILVGVNRSERAEGLAVRAAEVAAALDATLCVIMCVDRAESGLQGGTGFAADRAADHRRFLDDVCARLPHRRTTTMLAAGDPAEVLVTEAERLDAQMIVVGNHRAQGAASVLGSIARDVTKASQCDVLVVNTKR